MAWQGLSGTDAVTKVVSLQKFRREQLRQKGKQSTLCGNNMHSWELVTNSQFDVKHGKLVSVYRCKRCKKEKVEAH
jgi:hypothetical protein